ncbi:primary amine oxidase 2-like [Vigna umbellata]|uniref:primary amine oxidase 2-like n=1 Tax=Vigna umbellata TaxID=87088 RepID=UPI001F5FEDCB|nr:primary amine oxidase 2-like [Vigna umbellata]
MRRRVMNATTKVTLLTVLVFWSCEVECNHPHPLDPLTPSELNRIRTIVQKSYPTSKTTNSQSHLQLRGFGRTQQVPNPLMDILKNPKIKPSSPPPRRAFVVVRFQKHSHQIKWTCPLLPSSQRTCTRKRVPYADFGEQTVASQLPFSYEPFKESLRNRGLNASQVLCASFSIGWFGEAKSKRNVKVKCYYTNGTANFYARPLEGVAAVVDLDEMKIVGYDDRYVIPVPKAEGTEYRASKLKPPPGPKLKGIVAVNATSDLDSH